MSSARSSALICDVARGQHEDLAGDPLHAAIQRVRQAAGEVDEPLGELGVGALEVQHDGDRLLELVGDLLRVVEGLGDDEVDAHVAVARGSAVDGPQHGGRTARGARLVVGEDVVEVVAARPARRQAADVRALAVHVLHLGLGLGRGRRALARALALARSCCSRSSAYSSTYARSSARPKYTSARCQLSRNAMVGGKVRPRRRFSCKFRWNSVVPMRTIVAPSSTATS